MDKPFDLSMENLIAILESITQIRRTSEDIQLQLKIYNSEFGKKLELRKVPECLFAEIEFQLENIQQESITADNAKILYRLLELLRNLVAQVPENQILVSKSRTISLLLEILSTWSQSIMGSKGGMDMDVFRMGIQCLSNIMTGNLEVREQLWPVMVSTSLFVQGLTDKEPKTVRSTLVWLRNCVDSKNITELLQQPSGPQILLSLLRISEMSVEDEMNPEFDLCVSIISFGLEKDLLPNMIGFCPTKNEKETLLRLMDGVINSSSASCSISLGEKTCRTMFELLEHETDIFSPAGTASNTIGLILQVWGGLTSQTTPHAQVWLDLGITNILKELLTKLESVPRVTAKTFTKNVQDNHLFLLKSDTIRIISNLAYHYPQFQDEFRLVGGIPLILNNCNLDDLNPFIKEMSLFCIRNLVTGNATNQKLLDELEPKQVLKSDVLDQLNVEAKIDSSGKLLLSKLV